MARKKSKSGGKILVVGAIAGALTLAGIAGASAYYKQYVVNYAFQSSIFRRPVIARAYQTYPSGTTAYLWTAGTETPTAIGSSLALLKPSYVTGLIRVDSAAPILPTTVTGAFNTIRASVLTASPKVLFDVTVQTSQFFTAPAGSLTSFLNQLVPQIPLDAFWFDSFEGASPTLQQEAIAASHSLGKLAVGDETGVSGAVSSVPNGLDAVASIIPSTLPIALPGWMSLLLSKRIPVLLHVNNFAPDRQTFVTTWTQAQRVEWLNESSTMQAAGRYAFVYNAFFPEDPISTDYDAVRDGTLGTMAQLIDSNNPPLA